MQIYPQEIAAITYVPQLPPQARKLVEELADSFSWILRSAMFWSNLWSLAGRGTIQPTDLSRKEWVLSIVWCVLPWLGNGAFSGKD